LAYELAVNSGIEISPCRIETMPYIEEILHQIWRRIIFNLAISNTDDHLRNHDFIRLKAL